MREPWDNFKRWCLAFTHLHTMVQAHKATFREHRTQLHDLTERLDRMESYKDQVAGFSRDLQIIRDRITREWKVDPRVQQVYDDVEELKERAGSLEAAERLRQEQDDDTPRTADRDVNLSRIADCLERAFPPPAPPTPPSRPSDLSDLRTVTSEDADARSREWRELARRHNIAPDSDLFQELILAFEQEAAARDGQTPPIDWEETFREADIALGDAETEAEEEAAAHHGEPAARE